MKEMFLFLSLIQVMHPLHCCWASSERDVDKAPIEFANQKSFVNETEGVSGFFVPGKSEEPRDVVPLNRYMYQEENDVHYHAVFDGKKDDVEFVNNAAQRLKSYLESNKIETTEQMEWALEAISAREDSTEEGEASLLSAVVVRLDLSTSPPGCIYGKIGTGGLSVHKKYNGNFVASDGKLKAEEVKLSKKDKVLTLFTNSILNPSGTGSRQPGILETYRLLMKQHLQKRTAQEVVQSLGERYKTDFAVDASLMVVQLDKKQPKKDKKMPKPIEYKVTYV